MNRIDKETQEFLLDIFPSPIDETWRRPFWIKWLLSFHNIPCALGEKYNMFQRGREIKEMALEICDILFQEINLEKENTIYIEADQTLAKIISVQDFRKGFLNIILEAFGSDDVFILLPRNKLVVGIDHEGNFFKFDYREVIITPKYQYQYRIISNNISHIEQNPQGVGNKFRYEICFNDNLENLSKIREHLLGFNLNIIEVNNESYPHKDVLLTKEQVRFSSEALLKMNVDFEERDLQKNKSFLKHFY